MFNNRLTHTLLLSMLFVFFAFGSSFAYGYWQQISFTSSAVVEFNSETPQLHAEIVSETVAVSLVPTGFAMMEDQVEEVDFIYRLSIDKEIARTMDLVVETMEVTIDGQALYTNLVAVTIDGSPNSLIRDIFNEDVEVRANVRLSEPIDASEAQSRGLPLSVVNVDNARLAYEAIAGKQLVITFRFAIAAKQSSPQA